MNTYNSFLGGSRTYDLDCSLGYPLIPTALCSALDKENSIEFLLDLVYYIYMQSNPNPVLLSHASL